MLKLKTKSRNIDESQLSHTKYNCLYHIVFIPKFRRKAVYGKLRRDIGIILRRLCEYKEVEIIEAHACIDHIHILVKIPPKLSVSQFMGYLKGKSALMIFTSISFIKSKNYILDELYNKRTNYDAQIFFSKEIDNDLIKELNELDYTKDIQTLYYYNGNITGNNKSRKTTINGINKDSKLINIYDINNKNKINLSSEGIILEKHIAKDLDVGINDYVTVNNKKLKVINLSNQCINRINYISDKEIDKIGTTDIYSVILNINKDHHEDLVKYLSTKDNYLYTAYTSRGYENLLKTFKTYDLAAWIIIVFAIIIGFVIV